MKHETQAAVTHALSNIKKTKTDFNDLPGQSRLFLHFQYDHEKVARFYPSLGLSLNEVAENVLSNYKVDRSEVAAALLEINREFDAAPDVLENIKKFEQNDCVAIVTGQQTGLFGGPLYTIYKALSAIKYSENLNKKGIKTVPIFWMATEDHDSEEIASTNVFNRNAVKTLQLDFDDADAGKQVGEIQLPDTVNDLINEVLSLTASSNYREEIADILRKSWTPGETISSAFGKMMMSLLGKYGLIIVDATNEKLRRLASPIFSNAVKRSDELVDAIIARNHELTEKGYHAQVLVEDNYFPLFYIDSDGHRLSLKKIGDDRFAAGDSKLRFLREELLEIAEHKPEKLSPGVMLRPVVQDWLFPTVKYFGGAAEVAYFAQNSVVYELLGRPVTPVGHRQSFTIIDDGARRAVEKYGLELRKVFTDREDLTSKILSDITDTSGAQKIESVIGEIKELFAGLDNRDIIDEQTLDMRRRKINYHLEAIKRAYIKRQLARDETLAKRVSAFYDWLLPNGALQERSINLFAFAAKHGLGIVELLYQVTDPDEKDHIEIYL